MPARGLSRTRALRGAPLRSGAERCVQSRNIPLPPARSPRASSARETCSWQHEQFFIDPFNVFLVTLTAFVGLTTSLFSRPYMRVEIEHGRVTAGRLRLYHSMYQLFMATMLVALTTNNLGLLWVAMEAATLSTVLLVTLYRTPASLEAGWKYFILCGVGIAQALFGTILLYLAAERVLGAEGVSALLWTHLDAVKGQLEPTVLGLAFVFLLVGYGTKVGLAPLHNWLPDAHAEGPTPISAVLSGLLLNVAIYAVVRCKILVEGALHSPLPSRMLMGFGLRLDGVGRVLSLAPARHQASLRLLLDRAHGDHHLRLRYGRAGGELCRAAAHDGALAHQVRESSSPSAMRRRRHGSQLMDDIRGLITLSPTVGWGLMMGSLAILGMPPFGVFASEFLILTTAMREQPWATPILLTALGVAFAAIFGRVQPMVFGETARQAPAACTGAAAGVRAPGHGAGVGSLHTAVSGGLVSRGGALDRRGLRWRYNLARCHAPSRPSCRACARSPYRVSNGGRNCRDLAAAGARLLALWGSPRRAGSAHRVGSVFRRSARRSSCSCRFRNADAPYPGLEEIFPAAARMQRAMADLLGLRSTDPDTRPWLRHAAWPATYRPLIDPPARAGSVEPAADDYEFVRVEGDGVHEIAVGPVHAGTIEPGHFRFSVVGEKVLRLEERLGYAHKGIERRFTELPILEGHRLAARVCGRLRRRILVGLLSSARGDRRRPTSRREPPGCARSASSSSALPITWAISARSATTPASLSGSPSSRDSRSCCCAPLEEALGERYLLNAVIPGGTRLDLSAVGATALRRCLLDIAREVVTLESIYNDHAGLRDRFTGAGTVEPRLAARLGLIGLAGRASGQALDLRCDLPMRPLPAALAEDGPRPAGDVAARVAVRFDELEESCRLVHRILEGLPREPAHAQEWRYHRPVPSGIGLIEGWRGPVLVALEAGRRRRNPPLSSARSLVAELAGARARHHRQHRSRFSAHQQVLQSFLQRARPVAGHPCSRHSVRSPRSESLPSRHPDRGRKLACSRAARATDSLRARRRAVHSARRRRLLQRLRARDPRAQQPALQSRGARHSLRREPAPRGHAARDRSGLQAHGGGASTSLRGDARSQARRRPRRLRVYRRHLR